MNRLFLLSTGRSGTTFLADFFGSFGQVVSRNEQSPAFKRRGIELVSRPTNFYEKQYFKWSRRLDTVLSGSDWFVETNCRLFGASHLIESVFPEALRFHLIRDGRDVVRSWVNKGRYTRADTATRFTPHDVPGDPYRNRWKQLNSIQRNAWSWSMRNRIIADSNPDDLYYFEGIFKKPHEEIFRMLETLGLDYKEEDIQEKLQKKIFPTRNDFLPPFPDWRDDWKQQFWEIAGEVMEEFGYDSMGIGESPKESQPPQE